MAERSRTILTAIIAAIGLIVPVASVAIAEETRWTVTLHPADIVVGDALGQLHTRRQWTAGFDNESGAFEVAVRKTAVPISAPRCLMDYLVLKIPIFYPENPKRASTSERRTVYDALMLLQSKRQGRITAAVEAPEPLSRKGREGIELVACNLYFALPLQVQVSAQ